ncbi:MAG TPA: hypothetical protein VHE35_08310, partial [Kofleriaceae bacterium]|nr:hypothetical protein [Kofleriaceae bacterium]
PEPQPAASQPTPPTPAPPPIRDEVIGLLDVRFEGMSDTAGALLIREIADRVTHSGYIVVLPDRLREVMAPTDWNSACVMGPCLAGLHQLADVGLVLHIALFSIGANFDYVISLIDTRTGAPIGQLARTCDVCTLDEALAATAGAAVELVVSSAGQPPPPSGDEARPFFIGPRPPPRRHSSAPHRWRRAGVMLLGSAVVVGAGGMWLHGGEHAELGAGALGAAATLAVAGGTCVAMSFDF